LAECRSLVSLSTAQHSTVQMSEQRHMAVCDTRQDTRKVHTVRSAWNPSTHLTYGVYAPVESTAAMDME